MRWRVEASLKNVTACAMGTRPKCPISTLPVSAKPGKVALPPIAREALDRYLVPRGLPVLEQNDEWSLKGRYMQLEGLQSLTDSAPTRLPAVAR